MHSVQPRVTIAIATRNGAATLREAVESCLEQRFGSFEVLVVDDGSTDGSAALLASLEDALLAAPIRFVYSRRRPPAAYGSLTRLDEHGLSVLASAA